MVVPTKVPPSHRFAGLTGQHAPTCALEQLHLSIMATALFPLSTSLVPQHPLSRLPMLWLRLPFLSGQLFQSGHLTICLVAGSLALQPRMCNLFDYLLHTDHIRVTAPATTSVGDPGTVEVTVIETVTVYPSDAEVTGTATAYV
jgi:hypothetical protein